MNRYGSESIPAGRKLTQLRHAIAQIELSGGCKGGQPAEISSVALGATALDFALGGSGRRGLALGCVHDIHPAAPGDAGAAAGFALGCLARVLAARPGPAFVIQDTASRREQGQWYAPGLLAFGIDPGRLICVCLRKARDVLAAVEETLACHVPVAVLAETGGPHGEDALTTSRRLALRAGHGGHAVLLLRHGPPESSAARTRFRIATTTLQHHERGPPAFALPPPVIEAALQRNRAGPCGRWRLGWNPQALEFTQATDIQVDTHERFPPADTRPAHSRPVVAAAGDRPAPPAPARNGAWRQAG